MGRRIARLVRYAVGLVVARVCMLTVIVVLVIIVVPELVLAWGWRPVELTGRKRNPVIVATAMMVVLDSDKHSRSEHTL